MFAFPHQIRNGRMYMGIYTVMCAIVMAVSWLKLYSDTTSMCLSNSLQS